MSNLDIYSPFKLAHHTDKMQQMREGEQPIPLQVQMIISDLCNHNCSFCSYRMDGYTSNQHFGEVDPITQVVNNNPNRMISREKSLEILQDCKDLGVKAIQFTGGGEPTVHPHHPEIFKKTIDLGLDLALVTNGTLLRPGVAETLSQGKWVRYSIDSNTEESYSSIRSVPKNFLGRTIKNIQKVVEQKEKDQSDLVIGVGFVVCEENFKEIYDSVKFWSDQGVSNIRISAMFSQDNFEYHKKFADFASELAEEAENDFSRPDFKVFNLYGDRIRDLKDQKPNYNFCGYMHLNTYIGGDLKVYTCCNNAYNDLGDMGSLENQSFKDYWKSEAKKDRYEKFNPKKCERCMFNNKNEFINYLMLDAPPHVNYI